MSGCPRMVWVSPVCGDTQTQGLVMPWIVYDGLDISHVQEYSDTGRGDGLDCPGWSGDTGY